MSDLFNDSNVDNEDVENLEVTLEDLVGEGKKYRDPNALAKGAYEKDRFIEKLKQENQAMREDLTSRQALAALVDEIKQSKKVEQPSNPAPQVGDERSKQPEDVEELVKKLLAQKETETTLSRNQELVKQKLTEQFGSNFNSVVQQRANELGVNIQYMNRLAAEAPQALLALFSKTAGGNDVYSGGNQLRTEGLTQRSTSVRDWNYYQKIKAADSAKYWDKSTQRQMFEDMKQLGDKFNLPS